MKKIFLKLFNYYEYSLELFNHQIIYTTSILIIICLISKSNPKDVLIYVLLYSIHLISLFIFGYKKEQAELRETERLYINLFLIINFLIIITSIIFLEISVTIILMIPLLIVIAYSIIDDIIENVKISEIGCFLFSILVLITFIYSIAILPVSLIIKITIFIIYLLAIPFIAILADNGMDIMEIFESYLIE